MMKRFTALALVILIIPVSLCAAGLQCTLPQGASEMHILSGGTAAMLEHLRAQSHARIMELRTEYRIDALEDQTVKAETAIETKKKAYTDRVSSLRKEYISRLAITLSSVQGSVTPSSSTLGDAAYYFTAKNNSDRIITDITYKPLFDGKVLPTTTMLVLEFIDPATMKSGLGPHETVTNQGHDREKFSFFISEIPQETLKGFTKDFDKRFGITIVDMHFTSEKGYKGQFKPQTFEEAFSAQLRPLKIAIEQAETHNRAIKDANAQALKEFTEQKNRVLDSLKKSLVKLKKSSVRYTASPGRNSRYVFDDIPSGTYFVYASDRSGKAVFEKIAIGEKKQKKTYTKMKKDPFLL